MNPPKIETVNAVTMEHGRRFAQGWFDGQIAEACSNTEIMTWPDGTLDEHSAQSHTHDLEDDICGRVFEAMKEQISETFVRVANAVIEAERQRSVEALGPPKVETAPIVTEEHGAKFVRRMHEDAISGGLYSDAVAVTRILKWPDDDEDAQERIHDMSDEIRDRVHEETKSVIADAFVRVANEVIERERRPE